MKIERENKILLQRMAEIGSRRFDPNAMQMGHGVRLNRRQQPVLDCYLSPMGASNLSRGAAVPKPSLNYRVRKREAERVQHDNIRMLRRIVDTKSIMSVDKLEAEHRMSRYHLARLSTRALGEPGSGLGSGGHPREPTFGAKHFYGPLGISRKMLRGEADGESDGGGDSTRLPGIGAGGVTGTEQGVGGPAGGGPFPPSTGEGEDDGYGDLGGGYGVPEHKEEARSPVPPPSEPVPAPAAPVPAPAPAPAPAPKPARPAVQPLGDIGNQEDQPLHGIVVVHVESASGLKDTDWVGSTDAYARVTFDGVSHTTATVADNVAPDFHESFEFVVTQDVAAVAAVGGRDAVILVELLDSDADADDKLGSVSVPLCDLLERSGDRGKSSTSLADTWQLQDGQGQLEMSLQWKPYGRMTELLSPKTAGSSEHGSSRADGAGSTATPASGAAQAGGPTAGTASAPAPAPKPAPTPVPLSGTLAVRVVRATGLKDADWAGKSDPYAIVTVGKDSHTTHTKYDTTDPLWNATYFFDVSKELAASASVAAPTAVVSVTLKDNDTGTDGDLGAVSLPIVDVFRAAHAGGDVDVGHADALLEDVFELGKDFPGRLELHVWWFPYKTPAEARPLVPEASAEPADAAAPAAPSPADATADHQESKDDEVHGALVVAVGSASNLKDADTFGGGSDGYVTLEIDGMEGKTKTIENTSNPVWGEVFAFTVSRETAAVAAVGDVTRAVNIKVMDEDTGGDDTLGELSIPLCDVFGPANGLEDHTISGHYSFTGAKQPGSIALVLTWIKHGTATSADTEAAKQAALKSMPDPAPAAAAAGSGGSAAPAPKPAPAPAPAPAAVKPAAPAKPAAHVAKGGTLSVVMQSAKSLRNADTFDKSDPYASVTFKGATLKTKTVNNNLNPVWDEELQLTISASDAAAATAGGGEVLKLQVFDDDAAGDDELGVTQVRLTDVFALYGGTGADATHDAFTGTAWYDINEEKGSRLQVTWKWAPTA